MFFIMKFCLFLLGSAAQKRRDQCDQNKGLIRAQEARLIPRHTPTITTVSSILKTVPHYLLIFKLTINPVFFCCPYGPSIHELQNIP